LGLGGMFFVGLWVDIRGGVTIYLFPPARTHRVRKPAVADCNMVGTTVPKAFGTGHGKSQTCANS